ncbi:MAG TPA: hypothetical protein VJC15_03980 [Candidatus Paceibacterota bacterium]
MKPRKVLAPLGIELIIFWFILWFVAKTWAFPSFSDVGDVAFGLMVLYAILLIGGAILYVGLRLTLSLKQKSLLAYIVIAILISLPSSLTVFLLFTIFTKATYLTSEAVSIALLPMIPLTLLVLRHLFLKILAKGK